MSSARRVRQGGGAPDKIVLELTIAEATLLRRTLGGSLLKEVWSVGGEIERALIPERHEGASDS